MYKRLRALAKERSLTPRSKPHWAGKDAENESSMHCWETAHMDSKAAISAGSGNWRVRVKSVG
ncbi:hypothetical protein [Variovorax rhizosphaerae]|uniref:Uncharacterized protein n=1 Tax=Variovorax rhizosphaerae TaxID=1836200 RepID=A0ABU8WKF7_9BURK